MEQAAGSLCGALPVPALDCVRLVERIQSGDQAAEEALVRYFQPRVAAMLLARTHDREVALDLQQEVLWESIAALRRGQLREPLKLPGFVLAIARNLLNNYFRSSQHRPQMTELPDNLKASVTDTVLDNERDLAVQHALERISVRDREILHLTLVDGATPAQIARRLGLSSEVVRQRKSRAIRQVQEILR